MSSTWAWKYDGTDLVANVAYDLFTSSTAGGEREYEIMVWLDTMGDVGPLSDKMDDAKRPIPIASTTLAGHSFNLFKGPNGSMTVYSFVATSTINDFSGDLKTFVDYLLKEQGFDDKQYLITTGAGTEAFTGKDAVFTVSEFSVTMG